MSDPSGCITYKPAALELYAPHANLPYNKMREPQKKKIDSGLEMQRRTFYLREIRMPHGDMVCFALCFSNNTLSLLRLPAAFIKERKMGLNDFIQKLVSTPHICQQ